MQHYCMLITITFLEKGQLHLTLFTNYIPKQLYKNWKEKTLRFTKIYSGCVFTVCVFTAVCVCVHLGWVKYRAQIPNMGHYTLSYVTSLHSITCHHLLALTMHSWLILTVNSPSAIRLHQYSLNAVHQLLILPSNTIFLHRRWDCCLVHSIYKWIYVKTAHLFLCQQWPNASSPFHS